MNSPTLSEAQSLYLASLESQYLSPHTLRKYRIHCKQFAAWANARKLELGKITKLDMQRFMASRHISQNTANKEVQFYKTFFSFCEEAKIIPLSPIRKWKAPRFRPPDETPYSQAEMARILFACERVGQRPYERLRARAAILILRHHALRISDVLKLRCDALQFDSRKGQWRLRLITQKNKAKLDHPVSNEVLEALRLLPIPVGSRAHEYYFWNGTGRFQNVLDNMTALLRDVYKLSGVEGAHNHRYRHSKVTEMLANGAPLPIVARFLGITDAICSRHYAKYSAALQDTIDQYATCGETETQDAREYYVPIPV